MVNRRPLSALTTIFALLVLLSAKANPGDGFNLKEQSCRLNYRIAIPYLRVDYCVFETAFFWHVAR